MERISENFTDNVTWFNDTLGVGRSSDMVSRDYVIGGRRARLWVIERTRPWSEWGLSGCVCDRRRCGT